MNKKEWGELGKDTTDLPKETRARFPELVDLVVEGEDVRYLVMSRGEIFIAQAWQSENRIFHPPKLTQIPFKPLSAKVVLENTNCDTGQLYYELVERFHTVATLPKEQHYHLCAVFVFFTYLNELAYYRRSGSSPKAMV